MPWFLALLALIFTTAAAPTAQAQFTGDFQVIAHGYGYSMWSLWDAKNEALDDLASEKAAIEASLPSGVTVSWGVVRGQEESTLTQYGWHATQQGTLSDDSGRNCRAELLQIISALQAIEQDMKDDLECGGWWGNLTGQNKCNEVYTYIERRLTRAMAALGNNLTCYDIATVVDPGLLPCDLSAHIYLAVIDRRTGEIIYVLDPWRYDGSCELVPCEDDPNGADGDVMPWDLRPLPTRR